MRGGTTMCSHSSGPRICPRSSVPLPSPAIILSSLARAISPNGPTRCRASSRRKRCSMPLSPRKESPAILPDIAPKLSAQMPGLRGSLASHAPMAGSSWFRTGGPAQALFEPADEIDLAYFLARLDPAIAVLVVGAGSNILVRDGGIEGVVIRLGKSFQEVTIEGLSVRAGGGVPDVKLASAAAKAGIAGLSFFRGIPGAIGGALRMNAGAYGSETKNVLVSCRGVDRNGKIVEVSNADMGFSYR